MDSQSSPSLNDLHKADKGKPFLSQDQVLDLLKENFNFEVQKIMLLDQAYYNQNFLVEVIPFKEKNRSAGTELTTRYVLKVTNSHLSKADQALRDVTSMMEFLSSRGFVCPKPVPNKHGEYCQLLTFQNLSSKGSERGVLDNQEMEDIFVVRLVTFIPGTILINLSLVPDNVFEEMGETLAQVHIALQDLDMDERALQQVGESHPWSLNCLRKFREFLYVVEDLEKRQLAQDVINTFEQIMPSRKKELPHGFIHGDFNDVNIIVDAQEGSSKFHMIGFIDFDDASYSCIVYDIGISLMYVLQCKTTSRDSAARHFLQGYNKYRTMTQLEKDCLLYCTAGRFVQSLLGGLHSYSQSKDEYFLVTQQRGWDALKEIWTRGREVCYKKWNFSW